MPVAWSLLSWRPSSEGRTFLADTGSPGRMYLVNALSYLQELAVALADAPLHCAIFSPLLSLLSMTPFGQSGIGKEPV